MKKSVSIESSPQRLSTDIHRTQPRHTTLWKSPIICSDADRKFADSKIQLPCCPLVALQKGLSANGLRFLSRTVFFFQKFPKTCKRELLHKTPNFRLITPIGGVILASRGVAGKGRDRCTDEFSDWPFRRLGGPEELFPKHMFLVGRKILFYGAFFGPGPSKTDVTQAGCKIGIKLGFFLRAGYFSLRQVPWVGVGSFWKPRWASLLPIQGSFSPSMSSIVVDKKWLNPFLHIHKEEWWQARRIQNNNKNEIVCTVGGILASMLLEQIWHFKWNSWEVVLLGSISRPSRGIYLWGLYLGRKVTFLIQFCTCFAHFFPAKFQLVTIILDQEFPMHCLKL